VRLVLLRPSPDRPLGFAVLADGRHLVEADDAVIVTAF
jgi:hypothetical protein